LTFFGFVIKNDCQHMMRSNIRLHLQQQLTIITTSGDAVPPPVWRAHIQTSLALHENRRSLT